jgi:DNA modification methylase
MPPTPYYDHDGITIYCGDSRAIIPQLDLGGWRALVVADGPYGIAHPCDFAARRGLQGGAARFKTSGLAWANDYAPVHGDDEPFDPRWLLGIGAARIIWGANHFANRLPNSGGWLVWDKLRPDDLDQATCELAWTDCVKGVRRFAHRWNGMLRDSERGAGHLVHPTQKPVALMTWCMSLRWTRDYTDIIDPYMGSGPVMRAAKDLGKRAIGIEIVEEYCQHAVERLRQQAFSFGVG